MLLLHQLCSSARWPNGRRITSFHHLRLICKTLFYWFVSLWLPAIFHQFWPRWQDGKTFWNKSQPNQRIKKYIFLSARLVFGILEMWQIQIEWKKVILSEKLGNSCDLMDPKSSCCLMDPNQDFPFQNTKPLGPSKHMSPKNWVQISSQICTL